MTAWEQRREVHGLVSDVAARVRALADRRRLTETDVAEAIAELFADEFDRAQVRDEYLWKVGSGGLFHFWVDRLRVAQWWKEDLISDDLAHDSELTDDVRDQETKCQERRVRNEDWLLRSLNKLGPTGSNESDRARLDAFVALVVSIGLDGLGLTDGNALARALGEVRRAITAERRAAMFAWLTAQSDALALPDEPDEPGLRTEHQPIPRALAPPGRSATVQPILSQAPPALWVSAAA